ncbi:hypothetical protein CCR75_002537 [Bremia lactucae]|uniref:Complex 1 LYR protein domain-containing protein n=1 Tax=Bremia lactucae TaxID=4779 RepID=A0A976FML4_BRELC|nr:hypothetical protein CCR75_002537 [Bremia lactucae]
MVGYRALGSEFKSLQYFLNHTAVLKQYREFLRTTLPLDEDVRLNVRRQIRAGFDANRNEKDERRIRLLLHQAHAELKSVRDLVFTAQAQQRSGRNDIFENWSRADSICSTDTRMDTPCKDKDGKEDLKGRLGTGWPWKSERGTKKVDLKGIKRR